MKIRAMGFSLALLVTLGVAPIASAVEVSLLSPATITVAPGATFTVEIALDNVSMSAVNGVTVDVSGLQAAGATVEGGVSAQVHFAGFCSPTQCFGGLPTNDNDFFSSMDLSAASIPGGYSPGDDFVRVVSALTLTNQTADGSADPGLAGVFGMHDPLDVSLQLSATTMGTHMITIGGEGNDGAAMMSFPLTPVVLTVTVPEPGAIAMSMAALGTVFGVVGVRRRR